MAGLENRVMQLEMLLKQATTRISALEKELEERGPASTQVTGTAAIKPASMATDPKPGNKKRVAPRKPCPTCGQNVYSIQFNKHVNECTKEKPSTKAVVKDA